MIQPTVPTSPEAKRIATIMHRQLTTKWSPKEIKAFRLLLPIHEQDLALVERYYRILWPPSHGKNILRHDLQTLLNNWPGEVDRATIWGEKHPPKTAYVQRKIIPLPVQTESELTEAERAQATAEFAKLMGRAPRLSL